MEVELAIGLRPATGWGAGRAGEASSHAPRRTGRRRPRALRRWAERAGESSSQANPEVRQETMEIDVPPVAPLAAVAARATAGAAPVPAPTRPPRPQLRRGHGQVRPQLEQRRCTYRGEEKKTLKSEEQARCCCYGELRPSHRRPDAPFGARRRTPSSRVRAHRRRTPTTMSAINRHRGRTVMSGAALGALAPTLLQLSTTQVGA